jgi:Family of unknown function (DUF6632)
MRSDGIQAPPGRRGKAVRLKKGTVSSLYKNERRNLMQQEEKLRYLKVALIVFGAIFIAGIYVMMMWVWPSGWGWTPRQPEYEQMIMGVYATLGVFLILAAKDPLANISLIWFTIWSSIVHGGIMLVQAIVDETERANLLGDIPALFLVAIVLWYLMPGTARVQ